MVDGMTAVSSPCFLVLDSYLSCIFPCLWIGPQECPKLPWTSLPVYTSLAFIGRCLPFKAIGPKRLLLFILLCPDQLHTIFEALNIMYFSVNKHA